MPSDTEIVLSRDFDAPRRLVFAALTKPELLTRWLGARGGRLTACYVDLRVGGSWRFVSRGPDGATMAHGGMYREIVSDERTSLNSERGAACTAPGQAAAACCRRFSLWLVEVDARR